LDRELLVEAATKKGEGAVALGLDIAKDEIVVVLRWSDGEVERPWSLRNPTEIDELVDIVRRLKKVGQQVLVGMESTGTYGEAVRRALTLASIEVHRVSGKAVCDYTEVYDGVPSQHDGKDAAVIAELTAFGKGVAWPFEEESEFIGELRHRMNRLDAFRVQLTQWEGRLEALLGAHWPELTKLLDLESVTLLSKQCRGLWHAMKHGEEFEYGKLLGPTKRERRRSRRSVKRAERRFRQAAATVSG
jgi:transposase